MVTRRFAGVYRTFGLSLLMLTALGVAPARAAIEIIGTQYQPDQAFPEHECFWYESLYPGPCGNSKLGANLHVYLRNTGGSTVTVQDVTLAGFSMADVLRLHYQVVKRQPASIWLDNLPAASLQALLAAGEPVWYKVDPAPIPPGGVAQAVIRLRSVPTTPTVSVGVVSSAGTVSAVIPVEAAAPQLASVGFSEDLRTIYLYWRRTSGGAPVSVLMDGVDVTASTTTVSDASVNLALSIVQPAQPLAANSYHVFQGVYADGKKASAGLRAWVNKFLYGTWGGEGVDDGDTAAAQATLIDFTNHGMNTLVMNGSAVTAVLMKTNSGRQFVADRDYGFVIDEIGKWSADRPLLWFIRDEPDAADSRVDFIPSDKKVGSLAQMAVQRGEELRASYPAAPTTLNIDGTYKPYNLYNYGQVPDVLMTDPYYQVRMREAYWYYNNRIPLYRKATYIYAVSQVAASACEPNPLHVILYSCQWKDPSGAVFPFPTPQAKRIEVYYALAGGAKGLAYWWWPKASQKSNGLGDGGPDAQRLWREIGLLGNEIKTAAPLLAASCPIGMPIQASNGVWVRALAVGADTIILLAVNDKYYNDEAGTHYTPVANASVTASLPSWLPAAAAFEISAGGVADVAAQLTGNQLQLSLGTLDLTRMIVITGNPLLKTAIQQRYSQQVQAAVCAFAPDVCAQSVPPSITQQPSGRSVCAGINATFQVVATGSGTLTYRWQKNQVDLSNNGHYSGVTTDTLTITAVAETDAGNYRCVVSNAHGSTPSSQAALGVIACNPGCLQNLGFESGFSNGIGSGWTKFVRSGTVTCSSESTERHSGSYSQEIFSPGKNNDGGVYQQFLATPGQPYTVKAWIKVHSPQQTGNAEGFFGIDPTGGTDPNSAQILWASKPWEYWSQDVWTVTAQSNLITVYLRGRATRLNQTAYIWLDDVELAPGAPTDAAPLVLGPTSIRWRWTDLAIETGYRVRDASGADKSGVLPADTTQWTETVGINPNTQYTRLVSAVNDCGESEPSAGQTARTLSAPPDTDRIVPGTHAPAVNEQVVWTAVGGFGPGRLAYYRYAFDQEPTREFTGAEPQWSAGTLITTPTTAGAWYLHVQGYNADDVPNGTLDYDLSVGVSVPPDLDQDGDVDLADFDLFTSCVGRPNTTIGPGCANRDFDLDTDVDQSDFGIFQRCYSGESVPARIDCMN